MGDSSGGGGFPAEVYGLRSSGDGFPQACGEEYPGAEKETGRVSRIFWGRMDSDGICISIKKEKLGKSKSRENQKTGKTKKTEKTKKTGKTQKFRLQKQKKFGKLINCDILNSLLLFPEKLDRFTVRLARGMNEKQGPEDHKEVKQDEQV